MTPNRPILSAVIRPHADSERDRLHRALLDIADRNSTISVVRTSADEFELAAMSESVIASLCDAVTKAHGIRIETSQPCVRYLETIRRASTGEGKYIRQTGGSSNYGHATVRIEPNRPGKGYQFFTEIDDALLPKIYVEAVDQGMQSAMESGILKGFPMVDVKAILTGGSFHHSDSNEMAFRFAGSMAFKDAARKASPVALEPVMAVAAAADKSTLESVMTEIRTRRGVIRNLESDSGRINVDAAVPLSELLSNSPRGPLNLPMEFLEYREIPGDDSAGDDHLGVTANKPRPPKPGHGSTTAKP